jgi:hypothetical protein
MQVLSILFGVVDCPLQHPNVVTFALEFAEEYLPDFAAFVICEFRVVDYYVDTREEAIVEGSHAVGGQEENTLVIFESAKEDGDEGVSL